jgi:hypothetical protein
MGRRNRSHGKVGSELSLPPFHDFFWIYWDLSRGRHICLESGGKMQCGMDVAIFFVGYGGQVQIKRQGTGHHAGGTIESQALERAGYEGGETVGESGFYTLRVQGIAGSGPGERINSKYSRKLFGNEIAIECRCRPAYGCFGKSQ